MKELFPFSSKLFKEQGYTIPKLCRILGIKNKRFDIDEVNYSRNETSPERIRWVLLFGKKSKSEESLLFRKNFLRNNNIYDYAVIIDEEMKICDIYEGYSIYNGRTINGRLETSYNGKRIVDSELYKKITERFKIHQNGNERLNIMTKKIWGSRY